MKNHLHLAYSKEDTKENISKKMTAKTKTQGE